MAATKTRATRPKKRSRGSSTPSPPRKSKGRYVCAWIEQNCVFTQARWIGKPFVLQQWQRRLIYELFEVRPDGLRRFRWALWGIAKKQGKTELAAALALYFLIGDGEPSAVVACAAASDEQADLVFGAAKRMCEHSPTLSHVTERFDKEIRVNGSPGSVLKRIAAAAGTNDGQNFHAIVCDELHEWQGAEDDHTGRKGRDLFNVLTNGTGAREQPMILMITTAGYDRRTVCFEQYTYGKAVQSGEVEDDRFHFFWVEAPKDSDYKDPAVWAAANPNFNVTVGAEFYADQVKKKAENVFRRYFMNQWTEAAKAWLPQGAWDDLAEPGVVIPPGASVTLGVDVGIKKDTSAIVILWRRDDGKIVVKAEVYKPPEGGRLSLAMLESRIRELAGSYTVEGVVYDRWSFERSAEQLSDEGLQMVEFPMTNERTAPATTRLYEVIVGSGLVHDGDPVLAAHVAAGSTKDTERGQRLIKSKPNRPIDALIALMIALPTAEAGAGGEGGFEWF